MPCALASVAQPGGVALRALDQYRQFARVSERAGRKLAQRGWPSVCCYFAQEDARQELMILRDGWFILAAVVMAIVVIPTMVFVVDRLFEGETRGASKRFHD
jgi:hypothetical protein